MRWVSLISRVTYILKFAFKLQTNLVWVSCEGENPADNENIKSIDYYPRMGFPGFYFPYKNVEGYTPPLVAVQFSVQSKCYLGVESI